MSFLNIMTGIISILRKWHNRVIPSTVYDTHTTAEMELGGI